MPAPDTPQIWKQLGNRRLIAAEAFYADDALKEFHRAADGYIARRANEPGLYQLDSKAVNDMLEASRAIKPAVSSKK